ncbi:hypothetical protein ACSBR1_034641 [Camellia fascicularis]
MKIMRWRTLAALFALILIHIFMCSSLHFHNGKSLLRERNQSRKLLSSVTMSANLHKLSGGVATKEPKKAVDESLRKMPPSASNPSQNK